MKKGVCPSVDRPNRMSLGGGTLLISVWSALQPTLAPSTPPPALCYSVTFDSRSVDAIAPVTGLPVGHAATMTSTGKSVCSPSLSAGDPIPSSHDCRFKVTDNGLRNKNNYRSIGAGALYYVSCQSPGPPRLKRWVALLLKASQFIPPLPCSIRASIQAYGWPDRSSSNIGYETAEKGALGRMPIERREPTRPAWLQNLAHRAQVPSLNTSRLDLLHCRRCGVRV